MSPAGEGGNAGKGAAPYRGLNLFAERRSVRLCACLFPSELDSSGYLGLEGGPQLGGFENVKS